MISPKQGFSEAYNGALVKFTLRPGTMAQLAEVGVRDDSQLTAEAHPDMPSTFRGWSKTSAYFRGEGDQINIRLGRGTAPDVFNAGIVDFEGLPR